MGALLGASAALAGLGGQWLLCVLLVVCAYACGAALEARRWMAAERQRTLCELEDFTMWAEQALACAPEQLDGEQALLQAKLQADYQLAQRALRQLR